MAFPRDFNQFLNIDWIKNQSTLADNLGIPLVNRFVCLLNAPGASSAKLNNNGWLELQVISVEVPSFGLDTAELELNGLKRYYAKTRNDGDLEITFLESSDLLLRRFFYDWMDLAVSINPNTATVKRGYMQNFTTKEMFIAPLDWQGQAWYADKFRDVFPVNISGISYNYGTGTEIIKTTVKFKYVYHTIADMSDPGTAQHFAGDRSGGGGTVNMVQSVWKNSSAN